METSEPQQNSKFSFNLFGLFSIAPLKGLPLLFLCFAFKQFIDWRCLSFHWLPENNCKSNHLLFMSSDLKSILSIYHFAVWSWNFFINLSYATTFFHQINLAIGVSLILLSKFSPSLFHAIVQVLQFFAKLDVWN